ncbi:transposase [Segatella baroniae B14]|uniref:Transposase n=1 Tax=Segatella baroniae B14 TaxID=752555 RepID=D8DV54_9BACT|nr:transposase [Segatella baroniae B14]
MYCIAHARSKFFYAYERGKDYRAKDFLDWFGWLYGREETYRKQNLSPAEIKKRRNDSETTECIVKIYSRMCELQKDDSIKGELMTKALNYLSNGWKKFFTFREDGNYEIDNLEAERCIRPLTVNRKNAPILGSESGVENLCLYMTLVETCKKNNISPLRYFERFFDIIAKTNGVGIEWDQMTPSKLCQES